MQHLSHTNEVGRGIAVSFVATIYCVASANLLFLPVAGKLRIRVREEQRLKEMAIEGVISILEGMTPTSSMSSSKPTSPLPRKNKRKAKRVKTPPSTTPSPPTPPPPTAPKIAA